MEEPNPQTDMHAVVTFAAPSPAAFKALEGVLRQASTTHALADFGGLYLKVVGPRPARPTPERIQTPVRSTSAHRCFCGADIQRLGSLGWASVSTGGLVCSTPAGRSNLENGHRPMPEGWQDDPTESDPERPVDEGPARWTRFCVHCEVTLEPRHLPREAPTAADGRSWVSSLSGGTHCVLDGEATSQVHVPTCGADVLGFACTLPLAHAEPTCVSSSPSPGRAKWLLRQAQSEAREKPTLRTWGERPAEYVPPHPEGPVTAAGLPPRGADEERTPDYLGSPLRLRACPGSGQPVDVVGDVTKSATCSECGAEVTPHVPPNAVGAVDLGVKVADGYAMVAPYHQARHLWAELTTVPPGELPSEDRYECAILGTEGTVFDERTHQPGDELLACPFQGVPLGPWLPATVAETDHDAREGRTMVRLADGSLWNLPPSHLRPLPATTEAKSWPPVNEDETAYEVRVVLVDDEGASSRFARYLHRLIADNGAGMGMIPEHSWDDHMPVIQVLPLPRP